MKTIKVKTVSTHGKAVILPCCEVSRLIAKLTGQATLSPELVEALANTGFSVRYQAGVGENTRSLLVSLG